MNLMFLLLHGFLKILLTLMIYSNYRMDDKLSFRGTTSETINLLLSVLHW